VGGENQRPIGARLIWKRTRCNLPAPSNYCARGRENYDCSNTNLGWISRTLRVDAPNCLRLSLGSIRFVAKLGGSRPHFVIALR
jgi:hypothetical protein